MVSGFFTSPWLHARISSAVARPILNSSKKLTSSTCVLLSLKTQKRSDQLVNSRVGMTRATCSGPLSGTCAPGIPTNASDLFDAARLAPGQVNSKFFRRTEDVFVRILHIDGRAVAGERLDVQAQRLHLLDQHLEGLGNSGLGDVLALDDRLVDLDPTGHVVGLDRQQLLQP